MQILAIHVICGARLNDICLESLKKKRFYEKLSTDKF